METNFLNSKNKLAIEGDPPNGQKPCIQRQFYIVCNHMAPHIYDTSEKEQRSKNPGAHQSLINNSGCVRGGGHTHIQGRNASAMK